MILTPLKNKTGETLTNFPRTDLPYLLNAMEIKSGATEAFVDSLPFSFRDVTAGAENEFQTAVLGKRSDLDLAITIESSNYYKNMIRRADAGDTSRKKVLGLERYLDQKSGVWENSWVRFPRGTLNRYADHIFHSDLKTDKANPASAPRSDANQFVLSRGNEQFIRIPVSYMLKLALADAIGSDALIHPFIRITGEKMMSHFLNDNTSPEIFSFHPVRSGASRGIGRKLARETLIRFLFTQLLVQYAEEQFRLKDHGQQVRVFFSASPPMRQRQLNDCISDTFYRALFMSPCLSGWARGEEKHEYMNLCHKVLSRSQINGISKLKEAGVINSNLVVLPNTSNISLANNGTHISIGSKKLTRLLSDPASGFTPHHEKYVGDLVIKVVEHFLCLFPGTYSASPCRLNFENFHPENVLGFLPHEIDYTHLRMIWRRWKRKAAISILGQPLTPFGPVWLDRLIASSFFLKGDFVPDFRLVDYLVALMSTDQSPALDGTPGNNERLKQDLAEMGIFDPRMSLYQLVRLRKRHEIGYSGYEHRYYSIFEDLLPDMGGAADLQTLITVLAYRFILSGEVGHRMIPDSPDVESERRQILFCAAIDLPTFYVKTRTKNVFLKRILSGIKRTRASHRYPGYTRVKTHDYKRALINLIKADGRDLIDSFRMKDRISDLETRVNAQTSLSTTGKLVTGILAKGKKKNPMHLKGEDFNRKAENFYIEDLRKKQIMAGFSTLTEEVSRMEMWGSFRETVFKDAIQTIIRDTQDLSSFLKRVRQPLLDHRLPPEDLRKLIHLIILYVNKETKNFEKM